MGKTFLIFITRFTLSLVEAIANCERARQQFERSSKILNTVFNLFIFLSASLFYFLARWRVVCHLKDFSIKFGFSRIRLATRWPTEVVFDKWLAGWFLSLLARYGKCCFPKTLDGSKHVQNNTINTKTSNQIRIKTKISLHQNKHACINDEGNYLIYWTPYNWLSKTKQLAVGLAQLKKKKKKKKKKNKKKKIK